MRVRTLLRNGDDVDITASYKEHILSGIGTVDIVATKK